MRKINTSVVLNTETLKPIFQIFVINEDGSKVKFIKDIQIDDSGYNPEIATDYVINIFAENQQNPLTDEEITYLTRKILDEEPTEADLKTLAGIK